MTDAPPPSGTLTPWLRLCGFAARLLTVHALVPMQQGLYLRPFARGRARSLPPELVLQAALVSLPAGQLLLRSGEDGAVVFEELWTRRGASRTLVAARLVDEALALAREAPCTRFSSRAAREDTSLHAVLETRAFRARAAEDGSLLFERAGRSNGGAAAGV